MVQYLPVRYFGGKWRIADWILSYIPPHMTYCEPFCGGAAVFFRKPPSRIEVLNDRNGDIVNFFDVLRDRTEEMIRLLELTPYSRAELLRAQEPTEDPLERARRFYIRMNQAYGPGTRTKPGWRYQTQDTSWGRVIDRWNHSTSHLDAAARRLRAAYIECDDALKVIARFDGPETVFYVDPPYVHAVRTGRNDYAFEMTESQHRDLAAALHEIAGGALLSGYPSDLYDMLYQGWHRVETESRVNKAKSTRTEVLWISPLAWERLQQAQARGQLSLFASAAD